jgi:hypothetical protein
VKNGGEFRLRGWSSTLKTLVAQQTSDLGKVNLLIVIFPLVFGTIIETWETSNTDQAVGFFG